MKTLRPSSAAAGGKWRTGFLTDQTSAEFLMIRHPWLGRVALIAGYFLCVCHVQAVSLLYEPFNYAESNFLSATPVNTPTSPTSPIGYLAPNFNNWYGTGVFASYQTANDGQVTNTDLTYAGLVHTSSTRSLTVGGAGHTMRLSLNTSTQANPNRTTPNATDTADPLAGTDGTLQATDTGHTGYYSILVNVGSIASLDPNGGVLLGFNNVIGGQPASNPSTVGAGLTIRPKSGAPGQFELGVVKNGSGNSTLATWDTTHAYNTSSTIFVVGKYQTVGALAPGPGFTDDVASLWINPAPNTFGGFDPAGALTNSAGDDMTTDATSNSHTLQSFLLRQTNISNNQIPPSVTYDDLRVGTNWADVTPPLPGIPGDFNGNGTVDASDYVIWREGGPLVNEVTAPGTVNGDDYNDWRARFGNTSGSGASAAVPEPAALGLLTIVAALIGLRRNNRQ